MSELLPRQHKREGSDVPNTPEMPLDTPPIPEYLPSQPRTAVEQVLAAAAVSDGIDKPSFGDRLKNGFGHRGRMIGATGLAAAILVGGGVALAHSSEKTEPRKLPTASAPAVPGPTHESSTPSPEATDTSGWSSVERSPKSVLDPEAPKVKTDLSPEQIKQLAAMSVDEFYSNKVSYETRLSYGDLVIDTYKPYATEMLEKQVAGLFPYVTPKDTSVNASAQNVLRGYKRDLSVLYWSRTSGGDPTTILPERIPQAQKALAALFPEGSGYIDETEDFRNIEFDALGKTTSLINAGTGWSNPPVLDSSGLIKGFNALPTQVMHPGEDLHNWPGDLEGKEVSIDFQQGRWRIYTIGSAIHDLSDLPPYKATE